MFVIVDLLVVSMMNLFFVVWGDDVVDDVLDDDVFIWM